MKLRLRTSEINDIDKIYDLQLKCFGQNDAWYKQLISQYINNGLIIETLSPNEHDNNIVGVLLQGNITPCNKKYDFLNNEYYKEDMFVPITEYGKCFLLNNNQYKPIYGILMLCIDENFRGKKLAQNLISVHFLHNKGKHVCLNTRKSNVNAYNLYLKMGYQHIADIKNKYFNPNEDSIFMVKHI